MMAPSARSRPFLGDQISPQINALWRGRWDPKTVEPARYLYDHELILVTEGACTVQIEKTRYEIQTGQYLIIPPNTCHITTTAHGVYRNCIHFDWKETRKKKPSSVWCYAPERPAESAITYCPTFVPRKHFCGSYLRIAPILSLIETLFHRWQTGEQIARALARGTLLEILILLMNPSDMKARARQSGIEHAYAVRDLLHQQSESSTGIQALLTSLGFSYPHLCRLFRNTFGITPVAYRNALRLEQAKALLGNPKLTIAEIAYAVGYTDAGYFTRQFRKQNGIAPRQLRQYPATFSRGR